MFDQVFYAAAAERMKLAALTMPEPAPPPRAKVPGLVVPRIHTPRIMPQDMGRGKGTVPTNPFSGNWQKAAEVGGPERVGRAIGGFVGKHPVASLAMGYGAYRLPDILRAANNRVSDRQPAAGYGTVHAARGLAMPE